MKKLNNDSKFKLQRGQVILLTLLFIGSSIVIFSAVAGYLTIQRLRATSNTLDSNKAIFAADSGAQCMVYKYASSSNPKSIDCNTANSSGFLTFDDPLVSVLTEYATSSAGASLYIKSVGTSNKSKRAFYLGF